MATAQPALHMWWEEDELIVSLAPLQGLWTVEQYLRVTDQTNCLIEFTDGYIEVAPMPNGHHFNRDGDHEIFLMLLDFPYHASGMA